MKKLPKRKQSPVNEHPAHEPSVLDRTGKQVRRVGKLIAFAATAVGYTLYAGLAVRLCPSEERRVRAMARHQQRGACLLLRILGVRTRFTGRRTALTEERSKLLVCNHLGLLDPFVLASRLRMALVGKAEIDDWPAAGRVARTMGVIFVERDQTGRVHHFVQRVQQRLENDVDVLAFPEGTTNARAQVLPFKTGVFRSVARQTGEAVLPLYLHVCSIDGRPVLASPPSPATNRPGNASEHLPRADRQRVIWAGGTESAVAHAWRLLALRSVEMEICVGAPIATDGRGRKELARQAQAAVESMAEEALKAEGQR